jgi:uncharacterized protein (DUF952 family)
MAGPKFVYKIAGKAVWRKARAAGRYDGSGDDRRDGFIHLCAGQQIAGTLERHFATKKKLVLIAFRTSDCAAGLKWETARGGELFPHHYGPLDPGRAVWVRPIGDGDYGHGLPRLEAEA